MSVCSSLSYILSCGFSYVMVGLISTFFWSNVIFFRENALINDFESLDKILAIASLVNLVIGLMKVKSINKIQGRLIILAAIIGASINTYMYLINCDEDGYKCLSFDISNFVEL